MTTLRRIFTAATLAVCATGIASATTIGFTSNIVTGQQGSYVLTLPGFNNGGGAYQLTGVELYFAGSENITTFSLTSTEVTQTATFNLAQQTNLVQSFSNSANPANKYVNEIVTTFDTGIGAAAGSCAAIGGPPSAIPDNCQPITLGPGATFSQPPYTVANYNANDQYGFPIGTGQAGLTGVTLAGTTIADYLSSNLGGGQFNLTGFINTSQTTSEQGSGTFNASLTQGGTTTFQAEVDYTYNVVGTPEPTSFLLMGGALFGLGLVGKRLKKS